jgi:carbon monoxide dehydrogenase subunit G
MPLAFSMGMKHRRPLLHAVTVVALSILSAPLLGANTPVSVDVENGAGSTYVVDAAFDVNVPASLAWEVLTDYEGIGRFVSSIRQSTIKRREAGRVLLEQHGVGRAWIVSLPMHVVLDVREQDQRMLVFRDVCGKSFTTYEGTWTLTTLGSGTRVTYRLTADPNGRQPAMLARSAIKGSVRKLLDEVRHEILARAGH